MVDHIRQLLLNPPSGDGYAHVEDGPSDAVMALFGLGGTYLDAQLVDRLLPLALAPDLAWARDVFDPRLTPQGSWPRETFFVYVDPNGGEGGSSDVTSFPRTHDELTVTLTRPTRAGKAFAGWRLSSDDLALHGSLTAPGSSYDGLTGVLTAPGSTYDSETGVLTIPSSSFEDDGTFTIPEGFSGDIVAQATWL